MDDVWTFKVIGPPVPYQRAGRAGAVTYTPKRSREYRKAIALAAYGRLPPVWPMLGRYWLSIDVAFADRNRRDLDNMGKQVMDALNGIAWRDDSQVDRLDVLRNSPDKVNPHMIVTIRLAPEK